MKRRSFLQKSFGLCAGILGFQFVATAADKAPSTIEGHVEQIKAVIRDNDHRLSRRLTDTEVTEMAWTVLATGPGAGGQRLIIRHLLAKFGVTQKV